MPMRKSCYCFLVLLFLLIPAAAAASAPALPLYSNLADPQALWEVTAALAEAGLPGTERFEARVADFNDAARRGNLTGAWSQTPPAPDVFACMDGWESAHDYSDANCRLTAFLLLGDTLSMTAPAPYEGTYLMLDLDAVETAEEHAMSQEKQAVFTSLFGDMDVHGMDEAGICGALPRRWAETGCSLSLPRVTLISLAVHDPDAQTVFVGHTGLLIDCGDRLLFVEKIAFEQPYQATWLADTEQLCAMLCSRPEYFGDGQERGPFIFQNDRLLLDAFARP